MLCAAETAPSAAGLLVAQRLAIEYEIQRLAVHASVEGDRGRHVSAVVDRPGIQCRAHLPAADHQHRQIVNLFLDQIATPKKLQRIDPLPAVAAHRQHPLHRRQAAVADGKEWVVVDVVVADVRIAAVTAPVPGVSAQHLAVGVGVAERGHGDDGRRHLGQSRPGQLADNALTAELLPEAEGLPVVHHQVAHPQPAGGAEVQRPAVDHARERQGRIAQRAERHHHRLTGHDIVDDLVPDQDFQRIGARLGADLDGDHRRIIG